MDDSFGHWLAGFVDGEGSFMICRVSSRNGNPHNRTWPNCRFEISLRADDIGILRTIRDTLGMGNLTRHTYRESRPKEMQATRFHIGRIADCLRVVDLFERYPLRAKKATQFRIWADAVREMTKGRLRSDHVIEEYRAQLAVARQWISPTGVESALATNPPTLRHHADYGAPPLCRCGCGTPTKLVRNHLNAPHPENRHYCSWTSGHYQQRRQQPTN